MSDIVSVGHEIYFADGNPKLFQMVTHVLLQKQPMAIIPLIMMAMQMDTERWFLPIQKLNLFRGNRKSFEDILRNLISTKSPPLDGKGILLKFYHSGLEFIIKYFPRLRSCDITLPETNIEPENGWLEYEFLLGMAYFQGAMLVSGRVASPFLISCALLKFVGSRSQDIGALIQAASVVWENSSKKPCFAFVFCYGSYLAAPVFETKFQGMRPWTSLVLVVY